MKIALQELGVRANAGSYVGDHPLDVLCAKSAGMDCAWLFRDWNDLPEMIPYQADYRINRITELLRIVG